MIPEDIEISIVVPVYNSSKTLQEFTERLQKTLNEVVDNRHEIIFVNDGSQDNSWESLKKLVSMHNNIIAINLTRNFGQHNAIMCGFSKAQGKYIITLDDDLQNPPEEIPKLYSSILKGYDVIYGVGDIKKQSLFRNTGSTIVQFIYRKTFNINVDITSFRIIKKEIVRDILSYNRSFTFIDGLIAWFTSNLGNVKVEHHVRKTGKSGYSFGRLLALAINLMTNFSIVPVQIASLSGVIFALLGFLTGFFMLFKKLFWGIPISGFASTIVAITLLSGVQLLTVGILGEYISRVHINVSKRPQYSVREILSKKVQS